MPSILQGPELLSRFQALDRFLLDHQSLWRPRPFTEPQLPWEAQHHELAQWLRQRSLDDAEASHNHPERLDAPAPFPDLARTAAALSAVTELPMHEVPAARQRLNVDVPGRKWQQIEAFAACLEFTQAPGHWLDWCSGKGHLGRRLLQPGQQLTCLEYDPALVASGRQLSEHHRLPASHLQQDVLAADAAACLSAEHTPVALHACGDLHVRLMQLASERGCRQLAIAPCCYNRISHTEYQPLSGPAKGSALQLSLDDLGLPLSETVTAGARVRRQRDSSMARRLAFDLLQRRLRGSTNTCPPRRCPPVGWTNPSPTTAATWRPSRTYPPSVRRTGRRWKPPVGSAWPRSATWSCCAACFAGPWSCGWCSIAGCFCRNRVTAYNWACSARHRSPHAT